ncbi:MAG: O-antigen ligase family protein [Acidobacteria bacterium]|nr:O-antigen ligase family protein [Acidobacteriota bacterium]
MTVVAYEKSGLAGNRSQFMVTPTLVEETTPAKSTLEKRDLFAYRTLLFFAILYFARPEDFVPGLEVIHIAKITGGLAVIALLFGLGSRPQTRRFPIELRLMAALLFWECLATAFAWWKAGALNVILDRSSKTLIVGVLVSMVVTTLPRLRKLMYVQAGAVAAMTLVSVLLYRGEGRMGGVLGGVFDNPNDLAINISLNWPLCLMFLLRTRSKLSKILWGLGLLIMIRGLMLTFSRTGFLALGAAILFCLIEFGVRQKRFYLIGVTGILVVGALFFTPAGYSARMSSIVGESDVGRDSQEERKELLNTSLRVTAHHPLLGIGPGNFESFTRSWHVTHNTYTELTSECGIPALIIFLLIVRAAFKNLKKVRKQPFYADPEVRLIVGGLWASLPGYLVGAFFASTAYQLFPYFLVAYTTALYNIGSVIPEQPSPPQKIAPPASKTKLQGMGARNYQLNVSR